MKKLHSLAFYALVTPAITLGSGALLAEQSGSSATGSTEAQTTQKNYDMENSSENKLQSKNKGDMKSDQSTLGQSDMQNQHYMDSAPVNGIHASNLIGAEVNTTGDESVGTINDLIIDRDGKVAAVVVGVGGFLGMGEKNVAINWDQIQKSGSGEQKLRINQTREQLRSAPEFQASDEKQVQ